MWSTAHFVHLTICLWGPSCTWQGCPFAALKRVALLLECFAAKNTWLLGLLSCKCLVLYVSVYRGGVIKYKEKCSKYVSVRWALKEPRYITESRKQKSKGKWGISSSNRYPLYCHNNNERALVEDVCETLIVICTYNILFLLLTCGLCMNLGVYGVVNYNTTEPQQ